MDTLKTSVPTEDHINVTIKPDGYVTARLDVPEEVIKVNITAIGEKGDPGTGGGGGGNPSYVHRQLSPEKVWNIPHKLNFFPGGIIVQDAAGSTYEGEITYLDSNTIRLTFLAEFSGTAYLS